MELLIDVKLVLFPLKIIMQIILYNSRYAKIYSISKSEATKWCSQADPSLELYWNN